MQIDTEVDSQVFDILINLLFKKEEEMKKIWLLLLILATNAYAGEDWSTPRYEPIANMYVYPAYVVVIQSTSSGGTANCNVNNAWSFYWADFDADTRQRIYSALLAAYHSQKPFKPIFESTTCGPEGHKKFIGKFYI